MGDATKHVVIVGGGFAGINAAKTLGKLGKKRVRVTLVDRRNHHLFQPLLYQVATAGLNPADISAPIRRLMRAYKNVEVHLAEVTQVLPGERRVVTTRGDLEYDYLILACGAKHSYFGHDSWEERAPGLKTIEEATEIRRRILTAFEEAELEPDKNKRKALMTFVVVGGGPTGVELAGALGEISRYTLCKDFRNVDPSRTRIILIESKPRLLASFAPELSEAATRKLEELGVTVWTSMRVTNIDENGVFMGDEQLSASTILWAAGIRASGLNQDLGAELDPIGRAHVEADLSLADYPNVFIAGDQAHVKREDGNPVPPLAPGAIQQGITAAQNVMRDIDGAKRRPFEYLDKGIMATIGRAAAVAQVGRFQFKGFFAWMAWCFIHILYLIEFRSKILVLTQWIWAYLRFGRGARLITRGHWKSKAVPAKETKSVS